MTHPMRRHDREISGQDEIDAILRGGKWTTVALADEDGPYAVTLSYGYDPDRRRLCFHAAHAGRKLDAIARDPRACATVVRDLGYSAGACEHPFESVVMTGTMRVVDDPDDRREAMRTLIGGLEGDGGIDSVWERNGLDSETPFRRMSVLVFEIERMTAKRGR